MRAFDQLQNGVWFMTDETTHYVILGWIKQELMLIIVWGLTMHPAQINSGDQLVQNFVGQGATFFQGLNIFTPHYTTKPFISICPTIKVAF